ncbi:MAG: hypothetical protein ABJF10_29595 [Chthoniobacter sp.]|uniref:hypothetical protein n=1 Tax=Chthoniobacter sp. TaxID=2510640 RepID=UPI0032AA2F5E
MSSDSHSPGLFRTFAAGRRYLAIGIVLLFICGAALAGDKEAVSTLSKTPLFAFGGIGVAGITSPGEYAFKSVLASDSAAADFLQILKAGTPQAQCYALVGLRLKDRPVFDEQVKRFASSSQKVDTCAGCAPMTLPMSSVVATIQKGSYDDRAKAKPEKPR